MKELQSKFKRLNGYLQIIAVFSAIAFLKYFIVIIQNVVRGVNSEYYLWILNVVLVFLFASQVYLVLNKIKCAWMVSILQIALGILSGAFTFGFPIFNFLKFLFMNPQTLMFSYFVSGVLILAEVIKTYLLFRHINKAKPQF